MFKAQKIKLKGSNCYRNKVASPLRCHFKCLDLVVAYRRWSLIESNYRVQPRRFGGGGAVSEAPFITSTAIKMTCNDVVI